MSASSDRSEASPPPRRFRQELLLWPFILGASAVSLYSTYSGFSTVLKGGAANDAIAIGMSIFLVLVASFCSYQLGEMLANAFLGRKGDGRFGRLLLVPFLVAFGLTASASGLFSYTFWHEQFYKISAQQFDAAELPRELAFRVVMPELNDEIARQAARGPTALKPDAAKNAADAASVAKTAVEAKTAAELSADARDWSDVRAWIADNPRKLLQRAGEGGAGFETALQTAMEKARDEAQKRQKRIDDLSGDVVKLDIDLDALRTQLNGVMDALARPEAKAAQEDLDAQRRIVEDEKQQVVSSNKGLDKSGRPGCKDICLAHKAAQRAAEAKVAQRTSQLQPLTDQRDKLQRDIAARTKTRADKAAEIAALTRQGSGSAAATESAAAPIAALNAALQQFENDPRDATARALTAACSPVLDIAKTSFPNDSALRSLSCDYSGGAASRLLNERQTQHDAWQAWKEECDTSAGAADHGLTARIAAIAQKARAAEEKPSASLDEARKSVSRCVERSGAMGVTALEQSNLEAKISDFMRANTPDRNQFERSISDLRAFTPAAAFGLLFAAFMELSILAFKMLTDIVAARMQRRPVSVNGPVGDVSDNPADRFDLRVYKALYRNLKPASGEADAIKDADIDSADVAPELRQGLHAQIAKFAREGRASRKGDGYLVSHAAIFAEVEPALAKAAAKALAGAEPAPRPPAAAPRPVPVEEPARRVEPAPEPQAEMSLAERLEDLMKRRRDA